MIYTVHAHPNSKMPRIEEKSPGIFDIYVSASPQDGKANKVIQQDLAGYLGIAPSLLVLKRGASGKIKIFESVE